MVTHQARGNWRLGFALAFLTTVLWAILPVAINIIAKVLPIKAVVLYRMFTAFIVLGGGMLLLGRLPRVSGHAPRVWVRLLVAAAGLTLNYQFYIAALANISPANAQMFMQSGPLFAAILGVFLFKEGFGRWQWTGLAILALGSIYFFYDQLVRLHFSWDYGIGVGLILVSAAAWVMYAVAQKQLLLHFKSQEVMFFLYGFSTLFTLPFVEIEPLRSLSVTHWWILIFCFLNTLIAYGCLAEAFSQWDMSRVGAVTAQTPVMTMLVMWGLSHWTIDNLTRESLGVSSLVGAALMIGGSTMVTLANRQKRVTAPSRPLRSSHP